MSADVKSDVYLKALPLMTSGKAELLDDQRLIKQLRALERRTGRSGKDSVDHEAPGRDDVANAACGVLVLASPRGRGWSSDPEAMAEAGREDQGARPHVGQPAPRSRPDRPALR